jgi:uncharacterized protein (TIRG00374 family)
MKKMVFNIIVISSTAIVLFILIFFTNGVDELVHLMADINYRWIAVAFGCMVLYWVTGGIILHIITTSLFEKYKLGDSIKLNMIGHFFSAITPFSTGGQPMQVYVMTKKGIKVGHAASIMVIRSMLYSTVLFFYTFVMFIFKAPFFSRNIPHFFLLCLIGFILNFFVVTIYTMFAYKRETARVVLNFIFDKILKKIKFLKNLDKWQNKLETESVIFDDGATALKSNKKVLFITVMLQIIHFTLFFSIPYFIYLAVEHSNSLKLWDMIAAQPLITMISSFVPTPGATGGVEGASYLFFSQYFRPSTVIPVILIWRIITYYSSVIFGGLFAVFSPDKPLKKAYN